MTQTSVRVQIQQRTDTASNWTSANPTLLAGEVGHESDTKKYKLGDGSTAWNSLAYAVASTFTEDILIDNQKELRLGEPDSAGTQYVGFEAPDTIATNIIWKLPNTDSTGTQFLKSDGSGNLGWASDVSLTLVDEDNFASNSASSVPSQQSVKAYVDTADALKANLAGPTFTADVTLTGSSANVVFDASDNALEVADSALIKFGTGDDLELKSDGDRGIVTGSLSNVTTAVSALEIDCNTSNYFTKTISGNSTFTFVNPAASGTATAFTLELTHSSGTITWPTSVKWNSDTAPSLTTSKTHLFMFVSVNNGTTWRGAALVDYVS